MVPSAPEPTRERAHEESASVVRSEHQHQSVVMLDPPGGSVALEFAANSPGEANVRLSYPPRKRLASESRAEPSR